MTGRKLLIPAPGTARVLFAVICAIGSAGGVIAALGYELKLTLSLPAVREWPATFSLARVEDDVMGTVAADGTRLTVDKRTLGTAGADAATWSVDTGKTKPAWTADPIGGWVAWINGTRISVVSAPAEPGKAPVPKVLDTTGKIPVALAALPDRTLAVVLNGGSIQRWDVNSMSLAGDQKIPFAQGDQLQFEGTWLAIWRPRRREVSTFSLAGNGEWSSKETIVIPAGSRPVMNAYGSVAAITRTGVWQDGVDYEAPGAVRSVALRRFGGILVTGDFEGLYLLHPDRPAEKIVNADPRSVITFTGGRLVVSGSRNSAIYNVRGAQLFTSRGRVLVYTAGFLLAALAIYMLALFGRLAAKHVSRLMTHIPSGFGEFAKRTTAAPPALLDALNGKRAILWAGSGLSAQAGHPTWNELLERLQKTAAMENWFGPDTLRALDVARRAGDDRVLEEIVQGMSNRRPRMVEFVCNLFNLPAQLSKSHYALYRMPFRGCVTTNYDNLLERLGPDWNARLYTAKSPGFARVHDSPRFFLMKLYGDLRDADTVLLCPSELAAALEERPANGEMLRALFAENSFLFVGVSPERLLNDLRNLDFPSASGARHWIVSGVAGGKWARAASELKSEFGVELIPFRANEVDIELPLWLDGVSRQFSPSRVSNKPADPWYVETRSVETARLLPPQR